MMKQFSSVFEVPLINTGRYDGTVADGKCQCGSAGIGKRFLNSDCKRLTSRFGAESQDVPAQID